MKEDLTHYFEPEIRQIFQNKIISAAYNVLARKKAERFLKNKNSLSFQKQWLKVLEEEYAQEEEKWKNFYFQKAKFFSRQSDPEFSKWFWKKWIEINLKKLEKEINKTKTWIGYLKTKQKNYVAKPGTITNYDIDRANNFDLRIFFNTQSYTRLLRCPFHDEHTPSFKLYPNHTYFCFGCHAGGDAISFVQAFKKIDFKEAVRFLNNQI